MSRTSDTRDRSRSRDRNDYRNDRNDERKISRARVYCGNLSTNVRNRDVEDLFDRYGRIKRCDVMKGFAFVEFDDTRDSRDAIRALNDYEFEGRRLVVQEAREPGAKRPPPPSAPRGLHEGTGVRGGGVRGGRENCVIVRNLAAKTTWRELKDFAREAGEVEYADIWHEHGRKVGVMKFKNRDHFKDAVKRLNGARLDGNTVTIEADEGRYAEDNRDRSRSRSRSPRRRSRSRSRGGDRKEAAVVASSSSAAVPLPSSLPLSSSVGGAGISTASGRGRSRERSASPRRD